MAIQPSTQNHERQSVLLTIPRELRDMIIGLILIEDHEIHLKPRRNAEVWIHPSLILRALRATCRQLRDESEELFLARNRFTTYLSTASPRMRNLNPEWGRLCEPALNQIRHLTVQYELRLGWPRLCITFAASEEDPDLKISASFSEPFGSSAIEETYIRLRENVMPLMEHVAKETKSMISLVQLELTRMALREEAMLIGWAGREREQADCAARQDRRKVSRDLARLWVRESRGGDAAMASSH